MDTLIISTAAIKSNAAGDATYNLLESESSAWTTERDMLASQIKPMLGGAAFGGLDIDVHQAHSLIRDAEALLETVHHEAMGL